MCDGVDGANAIRLSAQTPTGATAVTVDPVVPATFADLFAEEHPRLVAMVLAMTGDRGLAEDVAQEALARAYHRWDVVGAYDRPGAWVRRVAINLATSARRRRARELRALARVASRPVEPVADPTDSDVAVWQVVRSLPRRQATALVLYYLADESVAGVVGPRWRG